MEVKLKETTLTILVLLIFGDKFCILITQIKLTIPELLAMYSVNPLLSPPLK